MGRNLLTTHLTSSSSSSSSSSATNDTSDLPCTDFCDPSCGDFDECYTFPAIPDDTLPSPPSLPPTTIVATPSSSTHESFHISPFGIVVIVVLATAFLLISYYAIIIKYCSFLTRLFSRRDLSTMPQSNQQNDPNNHLTANNNGQFVDHPIWLISTVGLHPSIINSITVIPYKKEDGLIDGTDCSVCLSEFQQGETLRLLPKCKHAFHIDCIDTWLRSHTNCPMCRAAIVSTSNEPNFGPSRRPDFTQMADSDSSDLELGNNTQVGNNSNSVTLLVGENRGTETGDFEADNHQNKPDNNNYIALLVRRSYSMDYQNTGLQTSNSSSNSNSNSLASSSSRPLHPRVTLLKRSYSWSERVFSQNDRNSVMSP